MLDGLAIIETLASSEMSSSVFTFTAYETVIRRVEMGGHVVCMEAGAEIAKVAIG